MKLHYLTFDLGVNVTQNVALYPLLHVTYSGCNVLRFRRRCIYKKIHYLTLGSMSYCSGGDVFTKKYIDL